MRRPRYTLTRTRKSARGKYSQSWKMRGGYWPCLRGPFVTFYFGSYMLSVWVGLASYWSNN